MLWLKPESLILVYVSCPSVNCLFQLRLNHAHLRALPERVVVWNGFCRFKTTDTLRAYLVNSLRKKEKRKEKGVSLSLKHPNRHFCWQSPCYMNCRKFYWGTDGGEDCNRQCWTDVLHCTYEASGTELKADHVKACEHSGDKRSWRQTLIILPQVHLQKPQFYFL